MSDRLWQEGGTTFPDRRMRALAVCLAVAWWLLIAARNWPPPITGQSGCGTDPWDFLPIGEIVDSTSLAFIVEAHCKNAKYQPDGWIELMHGGGRLDVEVRRLDIAGTAYFRIVSIGGVASP
jgi:hypothetical protein